MEANRSGHRGEQEHGLTDEGGECEWDRAASLPVARLTPWWTGPRVVVYTIFSGETICGTF